MRFWMIVSSSPATPRAWQNASPSSWTRLQAWWRRVWSAAWMCPSKEAWRSAPAKAPPAPFLRWVHHLTPLSSGAASKRNKQIFLWLVVADAGRGCLLSVPVFQLQCAADAAGLLRVPANQQHREAGPHAAHPAHLPAARGVATSSTIWQRRPLCHLQCHVSAAACCGKKKQLCPVILNFGCITKTV